ncbi:MAG TPA: ankyrin repeat domain-containing protein [Pirellulales bacterium]|jgi:ankyrin repeat protein
MATDFFQIARRGNETEVACFSDLNDINMVSSDKQTLLHAAIAYRNRAAITALLKLGINIDSQDINGATSLQYAITNGDYESTEALLIRGADISLQDIHGNTVLWTAVFNARGQYDFVDLLMRPGASQFNKLKNVHGHSPLDFASQIKDTHLVRLLSGEGST